MHVSTVTTFDRSLLAAVRGTLLSADDALLCVAFVQERHGRTILGSAAVPVRDIRR